MPVQLPTIGEVRVARGRVGPHAIRTPVVPLTDRIALKLETAQPIKSFKIRGAANCLLSAPRESLKDGVWTASAGNMAQGAAYVARSLGAPCRVVVPDHAPRAKLDAITALGASIEKVPFDAWWAAMTTGTHPGMDGFFVHPFADTNVMAGNGTIGLELAEDDAKLDAVVVPWGGGGLSLGIAAALKSVSPKTEVFAVEVETAAPLTASIAAGKPVTVKRTQTWIDGMGSDRVPDATWPHVKGLIAGTIVVSVAQVAAALKLIRDRTGVIAEGAGAATVAAVHADHSLDESRVACIISGGNIDRAIADRIINGEVP